MGIGCSSQVITYVGAHPFQLHRIMCEHKEMASSYIEVLVYIGSLADEYCWVYNDS